jgi:hypothetical protein
VAGVTHRELFNNFFGIVAGVVVDHNDFIYSIASKAAL